MPLSDSTVLAVTTAMEAGLATRAEPRSSVRYASVLLENRVRLASDLASTDGVFDLLEAGRPPAELEPQQPPKRTELDEGERHVRDALGDHNVSFIVVVVRLEPGSDGPKASVDVVTDLWPHLALVGQLLEPVLASRVTGTSRWDPS